ncbi:carboxylesterase [Polynucleobacter sp. AP-Sving-400A-A2]|uniref:alpha/beta hydrolase n=1 Tax=Polynucleobacter sp. AP-Sving-400A-A2 TaxID=2081049 RepID=UPI001BFD1AE7|nr:alpha/beta hydrolase [Polynucleobacter sp. AP-Sving-400A-A2]QWE15516.1 alpha/beta hydrolase [Polynucleobacter sp. AP-Sving-400A-A2]
MSNEVNDLFEEFTLGTSGMAVVFLPGLQGSMLELGSIPKVIKKLGHTSCIPIIHGYSAQSGFDTFDIWLSELDAVVNVLLENHDQVCLVGLSMGATLAIAYEADYQKNLPVVALSPVFAFDGWSVPWYYPLLCIVFKLGITNWHYKESQPYGLRNPEVRRRVAKQILEQETTEVGSASLSAKHLYQSLRLIEFAKKILGDFRSDIKIICSIDDDVVAPTTIDWLSKSISSSTCKIIWLGGSYHIITLDNEREIVVNESVEFIQESFFKRKAIVEYSNDAKQLIIRDRIID